MQTITNEQFFEAFRKACQNFTENYKKQDDPDDPRRLFWTRHFEIDRIKEMPDQYRHFEDIVWRMKTEEDREIAGEAYKITAVFQSDLAAWFVIAGYDEAGIPPAPAGMDHTKQKMKKEELEAWKDRVQACTEKATSAWKGMRYLGDEVKTAYQIGQLVYIGSSNQRSGNARLFLLTGEELRSFNPATSGLHWGSRLTESVWKIAEEWSKLTDWNKVLACPNKVRRAIDKKMNEIIKEHGVGIYAR